MTSHYVRKYVRSRRNPFNLNLQFYNAYNSTGGKINSRKHGFMFSPSLKKTFDFLGIHLVAFLNQ